MAFEMVRIFSASVEQVWDAWTEPGLVAKWYSPNPADCIIEEMDVREGGAYRRIMPSSAGEHVDEGVYHTVERPTHLVQGTPDRRFVVDTRLDPVEGGTRMTLRMDGMDDSDGHMAEAWNTAFDKLDGLLGAIAPPQDA